MPWTELSITWERQAIRDLRGLPARDIEQIRDAVKLFAETGRGDVRALQGQAGHRMRVRERRVFLTIVRAEGQLFVLRVVNRGDAY